MIQLNKSMSILFVLFIVFCQTAFAAGGEGNLEKGIALFDAEKYDEAKVIFTGVVDKNSKNPEAWYYLGRICFVDDDYKKAIEWFEKAIKYDENVSNYHLWLGNAYGNEIKNVGKFKQLLMVKKFKSELEKAVELDADNIEARRGLMEYYLYAPAIGGGSKEKAVEEAKEIRKRDSKKGLEAFITIHTVQKKYDLAEKEYLALIDTDPRNFDYHIRLAWLYINAEDYEKAYKKLTGLIEEYPEKSGPYYSIGHIASVSGKYSEHAETCMLKFFELVAPEMEQHSKAGIARWHYVFGTIYDKNGKKELAKKEYQMALKLNPDSKEAKEALKTL